MDVTTSVYDHATFMFPSYDNNTRMTLRDFLVGFEQIARPIVMFQTYFSIFGIIVTIVHLIILTRKSMMTSSIISIMVGIAICDLVAMIATIEASSGMFDTDGTDCAPPMTYIAVKCFWSFVTIRDFVRRSSTWLGVLMALIRFLVIKRPMFHSFSEVKFGFKAIVACFLISLPLSIIYYFRYDMVVESTWRPMSHCKNIPLDTELPVTSQKVSEFAKLYDGKIMKVYMFFNGIVSKLIPCILLPLLTFLLILELRKAEIVRKASHTNQKSKTEKTTGLVIFMAICFFIVELPIGTSTAFQFIYTDWGFLYLATYVTHLCNAIFVVNSTAHCLICFLMSSQYRTVVLKFLNIVLTQKPAKASTISVQM